MTVNEAIKLVKHQNLITTKERYFVDFSAEMLEYFNLFDDTDEKDMYVGSCK